MPYHTPGLSMAAWRGDPGFPMLLGTALKIGGSMLKRVAPILQKGRRATPAGGVAVGATAIAAAFAKRPGTGMNLPGGSRITAWPNIVPGGRPFTAPDQCPKGMHVNKAVKRWEDGGGRGQQPHYVNYCVRSRRMNAANPRALQRAARRGKAFVKMYRRVASQFGARKCAPCGARGRRK